MGLTDLKAQKMVVVTTVETDLLGQKMEIVAAGVNIYARFMHSERPSGR